MNYVGALDDQIIEENRTEEDKSDNLRSASVPSIAKIDNNLKTSAITSARASIPNENTNESDSEDYEIDEPEYHTQKPFSLEANPVFGHGMTEPCSLSMLQYSLDKRKYLRPFPVNNASEKRDDSISTASVYKRRFQNGKVSDEAANSSFINASILNDCDSPGKSRATSA